MQSVTGSERWLSPCDYLKTMRPLIFLTVTWKFITFNIICVVKVYEEKYIHSLTIVSILMTHHGASQYFNDIMGHVSILIIQKKKKSKNYQITITLPVNILEKPWGGSVIISVKWMTKCTFSDGNWQPVKTIQLKKKKNSAAKLMKKKNLELWRTMAYLHHIVHYIW